MVELSPSDVTLPFLKKDEVTKKGKKMRILDPGDHIQSKFGREQFAIGCHVEGVGDRTVTLPPSAQGVLVGAWGRETEDWVGNECVIKRITVPKGPHKGKDTFDVEIPDK